MTDEERQQALQELSGTWPEHCEHRAFVAGAAWWQFHKNGSTMFPSERDEAEAESVKRYGQPSKRAADEILAELRKLSAWWKDEAIRQSKDFYGDDHSIERFTEELDELIAKATE